MSKYASLLETKIGSPVQSFDMWNTPFMLTDITSFDEDLVSLENGVVAKHAYFKSKKNDFFIVYELLKKPYAVELLRRTPTKK
jgi:hypothetical protein